MISVKSLSKTYVDKSIKTEALKNVSLDFPSQQFVAILGPSGCGKTTLLNLIGGLDTPTSGEVFYIGKPLSSFSEKEKDSYRNSIVSFIFQEYFLLQNFNVIDNVKLGLNLRKEKDAEKKAHEALKRLGIDELSKKKINELSGGQKQRVAIARAICLDSKLILADEPTGALDSSNSEQILQILKDLSKDHLVILITHNETLAKRYADRIIEMKDGAITKDSSPFKGETKEEVTLHQSRLPFLTSLKLSLKSLASSKGKAIINCIANSLGMLAIAFFLAINNGFNIYSSTISKITAASLPIVLTSYNVESQVESEDFFDVNANIEYPSSSEIYPEVSGSSTSVNTYVYNNFSDKFMLYLDQLTKDTSSEYVINYGNSFNFNLTTEVPTSLDNSSKANISSLNTSINTSNSVASKAQLPYNIFHVLYGNMDDYTLLSGKLPSEENELVLVVNKYNAISFNTLKNLGFYNQNDTESDVKDLELESNVKPISFTDVLNKEYKIFTNDEIYKLDKSIEVTDVFNNTKEISHYSKNDVSELYKDPSKGQTLKIVGIIRPKSDSSYNLLSPSLCYLPSLQQSFIEKNNNSKFAESFKNNLVFNNFEGTAKFENFILDTKDLYLSLSETETISLLPTNQLNSIFSDYFTYYSPISNYMYSGVSTYASEAKSLGIDITYEEFSNFNFTSLDDLKTLIASLIDLDIDSIYKLASTLGGFLNGFSLINAIVIIPSSLSTRTQILDSIDSYNDSINNPNEEISYSELNRSKAIDNVNNTIEMTSALLLMFAVICIAISSILTAITISKSVLERRKEIGLLRSLGASKINIATNFEIESLLIGLLTGILSCLLTMVLSYPVNYIINSFYPTYEMGNICNFTFIHALIIVLISLIISGISSLIPSLKASKEEVISCLRYES